MRALITGSEGFVGKYLRRELESAGYEVIGLSRKAAAGCIRGDLAEYSEAQRIVREADADVIFHLAGQADVGLSWKDPAGTTEANVMNTLRLLDAVKSPAFTLIFDTGNPTFNYRQLGLKPYPLQSSWEFYSNVKQFISYVHIKDATALPPADGSRPQARFTFAGEGCGDIRAILKDLKESGYDGGISMEPHVGSVFHDPNGNPNSPEAKKFRHDIYIKYCHHFEQLMRDCGWTL